MKAGTIRRTSPIPEPRVRTWLHPRVARKGWLGRLICEHNWRCVLHDSEPPQYRVLICTKCGDDKLIHGLPVITTPPPPMPGEKS